VVRAIADVTSQSRPSTTDGGGASAASASAWRERPRIARATRDAAPIAAAMPSAYGTIATPPISSVRRSPRATAASPVSPAPTYEKLNSNQERAAAALPARAHQAR